jgi:hypothetical protein
MSSFKCSRTRFLHISRFSTTCSFPAGDHIHTCHNTKTRLLQTKEKRERYITSSASEGYHRDRSKVTSSLDPCSYLLNLLVHLPLFEFPCTPLHICLGRLHLPHLHHLIGSNEIT